MDGVIPNPNGNLPGSNRLDDQLFHRSTSPSKTIKPMVSFEQATRNCRRNRRRSPYGRRSDSESQDDDIIEDDDDDDDDDDSESAYYPSDSEPDEKPSNPSIVSSLLKAIVRPVDADLYHRIKRARNARKRFQISWWFIIYSHDKRADYVQHLLKSGFRAPPWVTFDAPSGKPPFTTQWGNLAITLPAISQLFKCFVYSFRKNSSYVLALSMDEKNFFRAYSTAKAKLYDRRAIAEAIIAAADRWSGRANFTSLFSRALSRSSFDKVKMNHYRVDSIPSGNYSHSKGCISPAIFQKIAKDECTGLAKKISDQSKNPQPRFNSRRYGSYYWNYPSYSTYPRRSGSYNYNPSRYSTNRGRLRYSFPNSTDYQPSSNYDPVARSNISTNSAPAALRPPSSTISPSGVPYPPKSSISLPKASLHRPYPIYHPRLEYFATAVNFDPTPPDAQRSYSDYLSRLGKCPLYYCADYQVNGQCNRRDCSFHHICEWCASESHTGNQCPWRPKTVGFRKKSSKSNASQANKTD